MQYSLLEFVKHIVVRQAGLQINNEDNGKLEREILRRIKALNLSDTEDYCQFLENHNISETSELIQTFINNETYFFRDKGQFSLLKYWILPELIKKNDLQRILRIWSAGCSSGEEAYSLAILVEELISEININCWDIRIIGTDINSNAIEKAKSGIYGKHSFRGIDSAIIKRYFRRNRENWEIEERIKKRVMFYEGNLVNGFSGIPEVEQGNIDLILCRNVFIYFNVNSIFIAVSKLTDMLREGGYLFTGHSELFGQDLKRLKLIVFPESVVYQKTVRLKIETPKIKLPSVVLEADVKPEEVKILIDKYEASWDAYCLLAGIQANVGKYVEAIDNCKRAIKIDAFKAQPYYLLAQIAREKEQIVEEEAYLKKVIYLDSAHIPAYLELGNIYECKNNTSRALKMRETALELLKSHPAETRIKPYTDLTAEDLIIYLNKLMYNQ